MRISSLLSIVMLLAVAACRSHTDGGSGARLEFAMESPGQGPLGAFPSEARMGTAPPADVLVLEGAEEVRARAWKAIRGLKRKGAWL
ncbi:hypothetical protein, partial [Archangium sp.]|uniref:hypothetical protein n=1 Tax=Archangium sp. TaxID=1872627 RepID=UPI002D4CEA0F